MGKVTGFKEFKRADESYKSVDNRVKNYNEFTVPLSDKEITEQGSRCMDCGIPFCHSGCPLGNLIPDFNHMVHRESGKKHHGFFILQIIFLSLQEDFVLRLARKHVYLVS